MLGGKPKVKDLAQSPFNPGMRPGYPISEHGLQSSFPGCSRLVRKPSAANQGSSWGQAGGNGATGAFAGKVSRVLGQVNTGSLRAIFLGQASAAPPQHFERERPSDLGLAGQTANMFCIAWRSAPPSPVLHRPGATNACLVESADPGLRGQAHGRAPSDPQKLPEV